MVNAGIDEVYILNFCPWILTPTNSVRVWIQSFKQLSLQKNNNADVTFASQKLTFDDVRILKDVFIKQLHFPSRLTGLPFKIMASLKPLKPVYLYSHLQIRVSYWSALKIVNLHMRRNNMYGTRIVTSLLIF